jgi:hypothetical protein
MIGTNFRNRKSFSRLRDPFVVEIGNYHFLLILPAICWIVAGFKLPYQYAENKFQ